MLKAGEAARLAWIMWWVGLSAFVATIADREVAAQAERVAAREELLATYEGHDREALARTAVAAAAQREAFRAAGARVKARLDTLPDSRSTGWLVKLVHEKAVAHGCAVASVTVSARAAEPMGSGLTWLRAVAHLRGPYSGLRAALGALSAAAPGRPTGGVAMRQLSVARSEKSSDLNAECHFEVVAR